MIYYKYLMFVIIHLRHTSKLSSSLMGTSQKMEQWFELFAGGLNSQLNVALFQVKKVHNKKK